MTSLARTVIFVIACAGCATTPAVTKPVAATPDPAAVTRKALAAYFADDWASCGPLFAQAQHAYSAARCYAQAGKLDDAFVALAQAIEGGLHGEDPAGSGRLQPLHGDPRWQGELEHLKRKQAEWAKHSNAELAELYTQDQADRDPGPGKIDWSVVQGRDQARRQRVDQIIASHGAITADDYFHAAMVYQHGETPAEIQRARDLALEAVKLDADYDLARWLAAAAEDRKLMYEHVAQKWGTQIKKVDNTWIVWPVDPAITDDQRLDWRVPPIAVMRQQAAGMNPPAK